MLSRLVCWFSMLQKKKVVDVKSSWRVFPNQEQQSRGHKKTVACKKEEVKLLIIKTPRGGGGAEQAKAISGSERGAPRTKVQGGRPEPERDLPPPTRTRRTAKGGGGSVELDCSSTLFLNCDAKRSFVRNNVSDHRCRYSWNS